MTNQDRTKLVPFNKVQGFTVHNIPAYSNESDDFISFECSYVWGIFTGLKWQCVEFARRWLLLRRSCTFQSVNGAADMWNEIDHVERVTDGKTFSVEKFLNGSSDKPECGAFLIYPRAEGVPFGHIAVISEVGENFIRIVEQNYSFHQWTGDFARQIPMFNRNGKYFLEDYFQIDGWIDVIDKEQLKPFDSSKINDILPKYRAEQPVGQIQRLFVSDDEFLDENFFSMETNKRFSTYFKADEEFLLNLSATSNEIYRLISLATDEIVRNDDLLNDLGIPEAFWSSIRRSWSDASLPDLLGHFDWKFDGSTLKLIDYHQENHSMLLNSAVLQDKWAESLNINYDFSSTFQFHRVLVRQWKRLNIESLVHILVENDQNDVINAFFMQNILNEAKIESKICVVPTDLRWKNDSIIDQNGQTVEIVWGIWNWEKIFQDYWRFDFGSNPRLSDVFLNEKIRVIEPIWKLIPNHRAMISILNEMFPNHPNLTSNRLTNDDNDEESFEIDAMSDFDENSFVNGSAKKTNHVNIVSWMIRGLFSGFVVRDDDPDKIESVCCVI